MLGMNCSAEHYALLVYVVDLAVLVVLYDYVYYIRLT